MSAISLKSITGITSITTPAGVDNQLTLHNNNTTERLKIDVAGNVHVNNHLAVTGITTFSDDVTFTTANGNNVLFDKSANKLLFGNAVTAEFGLGGSDGLLRIKSDAGGNSYITEQGAGNLTIQSTGNGIFFQKAGTSEYLATMKTDAEVELYHNGNQKLETSSTGITVTGTVVATGADINGDLDVDGHTELDNVNISGVSTYAGQARFNGELVGSVISVQNSINISDQLIHSGDPDTMIRFPANDTFTVETAGTERLRINSTGELISTNGTLRRNVGDSSFTVSGDTASNTGANINLYGSSHGSLANVFRVRTGSTEKVRIDSNGYLSFAGDTDTYIHHPSANQLAITRAGGSAPLMRWGTGGNGVTVGVNTDGNLVTGGEILSVRGYTSIKSYNAAYAALYTHNEQQGGGSICSHILFNVSGANRGGFGYDTDNSTLIFNNQNSISIKTGATGLNGTERLRIASDGKISINHIAGQDSPAGILDVRSEIGPHPLGAVFRKDYGGDTTDSSHKVALTIWGQDHNDLDHTTGTDFYGPMIGFGARTDESAPNTGDVRAGISYVYNGDLTFHAEAGGSVTDGSNERLRIDGNTGNIGIQNKSPQDKLSINQGAIFQRNYYNDSSNSDVKSLTFPLYLPSGTHIIADMGNTDSGTVGFAKLDYVCLYSYAGTDMGMGTKYASTRRTNSDSQWRDFDDQTGQNNGENRRPTLAWTNGQLSITVGGSVQMTGMITIFCHSNSSAMTLTRNISLDA